MRTEDFDQSESLNAHVCLIAISHGLTDLISTSSSAYREHRPVCQPNKKQHPPAPREPDAQPTHIRRSEADSIRHGEKQSSNNLTRRGPGGVTLCNPGSLSTDTVFPDRSANVRKLWRLRNSSSEVAVCLRLTDHSGSTGEGWQLPSLRTDRISWELPEIWSWLPTSTKSWNITTFQSFFDKRVTWY